MRSQEWLEREREENLAFAAFIKDQAAAAERAKVVAMLQRERLEWRKYGCAAEAAAIGAAIAQIEAFAHHEGDAG